MKTQPEFDPRKPFPTPILQGCALCRGTGNCSHALTNGSAGVYCGDLVTTFQPCCCQYQAECMTTIFSDRCECLTEEDIDRFLTARFTVFCVFTAVMWVALIYDRMCSRPYKVMNSSRHHMLPDSPSVARANGSSAPRETAQDQELLEIDDDQLADVSVAGIEEGRTTTDSSAAAATTTPAATADSRSVDQDDAVLPVSGHNGTEEIVVELHVPPRAHDVGSIQSV